MVKIGKKINKNETKALIQHIINIYKSFGFNNFILATGINKCEVIEK